MDTIGQSTVSVLEPVSKAFEKTKDILFNPFDLKKWCIIGFCAWLAMLGEGGGGSGHFGGGHQDAGGGGFEGAQVKAWLESNLYWLVPVIIAVVLFIIVVCILMLWLRSRGKFMYLHCVALNRAEVTAPWRMYGQQGNSLFLFKLSLGAISFLCIVPFVALLTFSIWLIAEADAVAGGVMLIVFAALLLIVIGIGFGIISKFTNDFVVPIMALRYCRVMTAWREFGELLKINKGRFVLYLLFQIVIVLIIGAITSVVTLMSCCFCCTIMIPFLGMYIPTVVFLPLFTFARSYSLLYLAQYGPAYDVFAAAAAPPVQEPQGFIEGNGI